jgi:hypothetical protein
MMERSHNIFLDLCRYPLIDNRNPEENQHTAFFNYILNSNKELLVHILKEMLSQKTTKVAKLGPEDLADVCMGVSEKHNRKTIYPDMKVTTIDGSLTVYIENKIRSKNRIKYRDSENSATQLHDYLSLARNNKGGEAYVVYIPQFYEDISDDIKQDDHFGGIFRWSQIFDLIQDYKTRVIELLNSEDVLGQFLRYMEIKGMSSTRGFDKDYAKVWKEYHPFMDVVEGFLDNVQLYYRTLGYKSDSDTQNEWVLRRFYKEGWCKATTGFWINVGFSNEEDEGVDTIFVFVEFVFDSKTFNKLDNKSINMGSLFEELKGDYEYYSGDNQTYGRSIPLFRLTKEYSLDKKQQLEEFMSWVKMSIEIIENSKMLKVVTESLLTEE